MARAFYPNTQEAEEEWGDSVSSKPTRACLINK